ncbi:MAG: PDZ domain-containing protein [Candidatus Omnitrophica bacterium]|nr:PDZ domain-containing protein [Candidatus Omnitrophota bacterium]
MFRGVTVADSTVGVRVVSVEETSQAFQADLRPEDVIVSVDGQQVDSIDEFATVSTALKGRAVLASVLVFRRGTPREIRVHLYSYPILRRWSLEFIPEHDVRFAEPRTGLEYWRRMGRGFEEAGKPAEALNAYLNGLHNVPDDSATALRVAELSASQGQEHLRTRRLAEGLAALRQAVVVFEKLFDYPMTDDELQRVKRQLEGTLDAIRAAKTMGP